MSILSSVARENKRTPPSGGGGFPFGAGSAVNGTSLDVFGRVVLGNAVGAIGDPGQLLDDRQIKLSGNSLEIGQFGALDFILDGDPLFPFYFMGIDSVFWYYQFNQFLQIKAGTTNNFEFHIDDNLQRWHIGQFPGNTNMLINYNAVGIGLSYFDELGNNPFLIPTNGSNGNTFLTSPDFRTGITLEHAASGAKFLAGDVGLLGNSTLLTVNDTNKLASIAVAAAPYLLIDVPNQTYLFGDGNNVGSGGILDIEGSTGEVYLYGATTLNGARLYINNTTGIVAIGDRTGANNGTQLVVADLANEIQISNTLNAATVRMNGVLGFTGTVANPVTITVNGGIVTNVA